MTVNAIGSRSAMQVQSLVNMRAQLDDLQRQLGTGKKADNYADAGVERGLAIGLRSRLSAIGNFSDTIKMVSGRLQIAQTALTDISAAVQVVKGATFNSGYDLDGNGRTSSQNTARNELDRVLASLNSQYGDQYIFSGRSPDQAAVDTIDHILEGDGVRAGFKQVMSERKLADLGDGLGRLVVPAAVSTAATLAGAGATISPDQGVTGTQDLSGLSSAGGTLEINGIAIAIPPGADSSAVLAAINAPAVVAATGVSATLNGANQLFLQGLTANPQIDIGAGTSANILNDLGVAVGVLPTTNLLTQGAVAPNQTLTVAVGVNPPVTVQFGSGPGQISTIAALNVALGGLAGGVAAVNPANGNLAITANGSSDAITVSGTANPATFGLASTTAVPTNSVSVSEDVAGSVFGFKLVSASTSVPGAIVTGPAGVPPSISVDLGANQPSVGDTLKFTLALPDGTSETLTLTASASSTPAANQFNIGPDQATTVANIRTALTASISTLAQTSLSAASALAAGDNFFNIDSAQPPQRVDGPPFDTATSLVDGTSANTIAWYTGEAGTDPARSTAVARVDTSISVAYGMRANEDGIRRPIVDIAVFAAMSFSPSDPDGADRYIALRQRLQSDLNTTQGVQKVSDIAADISGSQTAVAAAQDRHAQTSAALSDLLQSVEGVPIEQVAAQILALQTSLQASLQTTALLAQMSLVNYL